MSNPAKLPAKSLDMEPNLQRLATSLSGAAGQYFVAAELSRRGIIATVSVRNARGIDILASNLTATRSVSIQVKTNQYSDRKWMLHKSAEDLVAKNLFYVFVNLNGLKEAPTYHIVPSRIVATQIKNSHVNWLASKKRDGSDRKDTTMRIFEDRKGKYLDKWKKLGFAIDD
jgi:hypothetical protein